MMRGLDLVLTPSECSRQDVIRYARVPGDRVRVTPLGVDRDRFGPLDAPGASAVKRRLDLPDPYILYVSRLEHPGKGHAVLIRAFARLLADHPDLPHHLVLAGPDWFRSDAIHDEAARSPVRDRIRFLGSLDGRDLPGVYAAADLFVFPSLYEGFGLPLLEAFSAGVPVACSNVSSLPEVAGDAAEMFNPSDEGDVAGAIARVLLDPEHRAALVRRGLGRVDGYRWEKTASLTLDALEDVASGRVRR
jgi:glycosyltransferase involved in cell wall biosynthesis